MNTNQTQLLYPRGAAAVSAAVAVAEVIGNALTRVARVVAALPERMSRQVRRQLRYQRTVRELRALSDRMLRDIGIEREAIPHVVASLLDRQPK